MAKKTITVSDLTGEAVVDPVLIVLTYGHNREQIDANRAEVENLIGKGVITKKRGRRPKVEAIA